MPGLARGRAAAQRGARSAEGDPGHSWRSYDGIGATAMPATVSVDQDRQLIRISLDGAVSDLDLIALSCGVRSEGAFSAGWPVLYDCSGATEVQVTADLVRSLGLGARRDRNRVAFVAPNAAAFGLARMYQIVSDEGFGRVQVFANREEALAWLAEEPKA